MSERHFHTMHCGLNDNFPLGSELRKKKIYDRKTSISAQLKCLFRVKKINTAETIASFNVSHALAKRLKPFEDGEVIKEAMTEAADVLFNSFYNNAFIKSAITNLQLSRNTATRRASCLCLSHNTKEQLAMDIDSCEWLSLQLDESTDVIDIAQVCMFVGMTFYDFSVKEELLTPLLI